MILYELKDYDKDSESTAEIISFGAVTMLKAICNVQKAILHSPRGIIDNDDFFDNKVENLRSMTKEEQDEILMLVLKNLL